MSNESNNWMQPKENSCNYWEITNRANQLNPNNDAFWKSRGYNNGRPGDWEGMLFIENSVKKNENNRSEQLNPNNRQYWYSRGYVDPPPE